MLHKYSEIYIILVHHTLCVYNKSSWHFERMCVYMFIINALSMSLFSKRMSRKHILNFSPPFYQSLALWLRDFALPNVLIAYEELIKICELNARVIIQTWWRHPMETFSALLALCEGNPSVAGGSLHKGQWCEALTGIWDAFALIITPL